MSPSNSKTSPRSLARRAGLAVAGLVLIFTLNAQSAVPWTFEWDAATQSPESVGFSFTGGTNPNEPTVEGLIIPDTGYYTGVTFGGEADTGWTLAFRVRRIDTSAGYGSFFAVWDDESSVQFNYHANQYFRVNTSDGLQYITAPGGDNQNFTDVQITKQGETVNIYFGLNDIPVLTYTAVTDVNPGLMYLGNFSSGNPVSEVGYLKWTTAGAYLPTQMVPEPSVYSLVGAALVCAALGWRKRKQAVRVN